MVTVKNIFKTFFILPLALATTGCYTDFEPDLESTPVVCINSKITAGEQIKAEVTRTWRYSEGNPLDGHLDIYLQEAEVALYVNDRFEENLVFVKEQVGHEVKKYFKARYLPASGDRIKLTASDKTYGEAHSEIVVPPAVEIDNVDVRMLKKSTVHDESTTFYTTTLDMILNVKFTDPGDVANYYIFDLKAQKGRIYGDPDFNYDPTDMEYLTITPDYTHEPLFSEHITPVETIITDADGLYTVFSDRQISGKQYGLTIPVTCSYSYDSESKGAPANGSAIRVQLCHISQPYYNYMLSMWASTEGISGALGNVGLGDPVWEFSNVSTRAGIVAAQAIGEIKLYAADLLEYEVSD